MQSLGGKGGEGEGTKPFLHWKLQGELSLTVSLVPSIQVGNKLHVPTFTDRVAIVGVVARLMILRAVHLRILSDDGYKGAAENSDHVCEGIGHPALADKADSGLNNNVRRQQGRDTGKTKTDVYG